MRKVIGIGETVLDIIFRETQPIGAVPGGSVFNGVISLGRSGVPAAFISETGNDRVGAYIKKFASENGVNADGISIYPNSKSPISLAFLNDNNDAEYLFYKDHPNDKLDYVYPDIQPNDIVLFGSYYALNPVIRPQVSAFLEHAKRHGAILYYDVNFRPSHQNEVVRLTSYFLENLELADIVRGSKEDFEVLFKKTDPDVIFRSDISFYTKKFIYTQGSAPVVLYAEKGFRKEYPVEPLKTVSTIGAGDNFNAGIAYGMIRYGITQEDIEAGLSEEQWDHVIHCGLAFSAECCKSIDNCVSREFGKRMQQEMTESLTEENSSL